MSAVQESNLRDEKCLLGIKELRLRNFSKNLPFLILSDKLPEDQVYREYADGRIEIQELYVNGSTYNFKVLRVLPNNEADKVRRNYGLL